MKKITYIIFVCLFIFSCSNSTSEKDDLKTIKRKKVQVQHLSASDFKAKLESLDNELLIDVRRDDEIVNGRIPDAIQINISELDFPEKIKGLDKNQPVMVYCAAGGRSKRACAQMQELGFKEIYELDTGFRGWLRENYQIQQ